MMNNRLTVSTVLLSCILAVLIPACTAPKTQIETILERGELRLATTYSPTTYMVDEEYESGFEYELARVFAEQLQVRLKVIVAANKAEMIAMLKDNRADIAAGLLKKTWGNDPDLVTGPEYYTVSQQVVFHNNMDRPDTPDQLSPFTLHVPDGLISVASLAGIKLQHPDFSWKIHPDLSSADLIELVHNEQIAYAAVYSNELILARQSYPELRAAFDLSESSPLIWLSRKSADDSLQLAIERFFDNINENEYLAELIEYFYGPVRKFDYVDQRRFIERFRERLPRYEAMFRDAAQRYDFDWRFLAAMAYQESHWNERARSPTGVRGLMMLTLDTARRMQVKNRLDPAQSILGGAGYIRELVDRLPQRIEEPDRIWLGLAAYNVGLGHLEDARIITQKRGGNPDKWQDVKANLPLLAREEWHSQTTNGQARGGEAVVFVENIRNYYNTLIQLTRDSNPLRQQTPPLIPDRISRLQLRAL